MRGGKIEFGDVGNRPYQVVLRVGELRRGFRATAHADERAPPPRKHHCLAYRHWRSGGRAGMWRDPAGKRNTPTGRKTSRVLLRPFY